LKANQTLVLISFSGPGEWTRALADTSPSPAHPLTLIIAFIGRSCAACISTVRERDSTPLYHLAVNLSSRPYVYVRISLSCPGPRFMVIHRVCDTCARDKSTPHVIS
jgi:hypothetical protein